jgi:hypothetical protein
MGESYIVANLDKKQYIDGNTLDTNNTITWTLEPPISSLLVWLVAECAYFPRPQYRGAWAGDRIVGAEDEGPARALVEEVYESDEWTDVTIACLESLVGSDPLLLLHYQEMGLVDADGRYVEQLRPLDDPGTVDLKIRQAIRCAWSMLPVEQKSAAEVEPVIRQIVDRALKDFREDAEAFGGGTSRDTERKV